MRSQPAIKQLCIWIWQKSPVLARKSSIVILNRYLYFRSMIILLSFFICVSLLLNVIKYFVNVGFAIMFYLTKLGSDGLYRIYEIGYFEFPSSLTQLPVFVNLKDLHVLLLVCHVFWKSHMPDIVQQRHRPLAQLTDWSTWPIQQRIEIEIVLFDFDAYILIKFVDDLIAALVNHIFVLKYIETGDHRINRFFLQFCVATKWNTNWNRNVFSSQHAIFCYFFYLCYAFFFFFFFTRRFHQE